MGAPQLLLFDLDGTLVDSVPDIEFCLHQTFKQFSKMTVTSEEVREHVGSGIMPLLKRITPDEQQKKAVTFFLDLYLKNICRETKLYPGLKAVLERLQDLPKVILTNKMHHLALEIYHHLGLNTYFKNVYGRESFSEHKPSGIPIQEIARIHKVAAKDCIMIGDTKTDLLSAKNAGTPSIAVTYGYGKKENFAKYFPKFIVDTPEELYARIRNG